MDDTSSSLPQPQRARLEWIDGLRWVAAAAVVIQHATSYAAISAVSGYAGNALWTGWVINTLLRFPVPVFFFLSGYVGTHKPRTIAYRMRFSAVRLAVPYLVWSSIYTCLALVTHAVSYDDLSALAAAVLTARNGLHLWFLASLVVITPIGGALWQRFGRRVWAPAFVAALAAGGWYSYSMVWHSTVATLCRMVIIPLGLYVSGALFSSMRRDGAPLSPAVRAFSTITPLLFALSLVEAYLAEYALSPHWGFGQQNYVTLILASIALCIWSSSSASAFVLETWRRLSLLPRVTLGVYCLHMAVLDLVRQMLPFLKYGLIGQLGSGVVTFFLAAAIAYGMSRIRFLRPLVA